ECEPENVWHITGHVFEVVVTAPTQHVEHQHVALECVDQIFANSVPAHRRLFCTTGTAAPVGIKPSSRRANANNHQAPERELLVATLSEHLGPSIYGSHVIGLIPQLARQHEVLLVSVLAALA